MLYKSIKIYKILNFTTFKKHHHYAQLSIAIDRLPFTANRLPFPFRVCFVTDFAFLKTSI